MEEPKPQPLAENTRKVAVLHLTTALRTMSRATALLGTSPVTVRVNASRSYDMVTWQEHAAWQAAQGPRIVDGRGTWPARYGRG